jgi:hypothetical protein
VARSSLVGRAVHSVANPCAIVPDGDREEADQVCRPSWPVVDSSNLASRWRVGVWRNPVLRTVLIASVLLLACVAIVAWDYGLMVRERASTIRAVSDTEVPFVFGIDADTDMTYPRRRVDVWLLPDRDWLIDIGVSVGPNAGRTPQRVVIHVQVPGTSLRRTSQRENLPDSFTTRPVPGGYVIDLGIRVPPGTTRKSVDATFVVRSDVPTRKRLGVSTVRLARGSPALASGLGSHVKNDGRSPPPVLSIHRITTYPVIFGRLLAT